MAAIRIDKYLADAGIGTRSIVKKELKKGYVTVNGEIIQKPEYKIDPSTDTIMYQGEEIRIEQYEYYILHKPAGYVSATKDNTAPTVLSLIPSARKDLSPVGRLDKDTEGLLLITNDGALSHRLLSPRRHVDKTYFAIVRGIVDHTDVDAFAKGLVIGDEDLNVAMPATLTFYPYEEALVRQPALSDYQKRINNSQIQSLIAQKELSYIEVTLHEGKFHQVKRMFQAVGKEVLYLKRIQFGSLQLPEDLAAGESRPLSAEELALLKDH